MRTRPHDQVRARPYESLWLHHLGWDDLTEENAARSVDLLAEQVIYIARLAERINSLATSR